jgi:hypothetical protein
MLKISVVDSRAERRLLLEGKLIDPKGCGTEDHMEGSQRGDQGLVDNRLIRN